MGGHRNWPDPAIPALPAGRSAIRRSLGENWTRREPAACRQEQRNSGERGIRQRHASQNKTSGPRRTDHCRAHTEPL